MGLGGQAQSLKGSSWHVAFGRAVVVAEVVSALIVLAVLWQPLW